MSRDSAEKLGLIAATIAAAGVLSITLGLTFPAVDALSPAGLALLLATGAWYYRRKGEPDLVLCLMALLHMTLFTACYCVLMYAVAAIGRPFVDDHLRHGDALCGLHIPDVKAFFAARPNVSRALDWAYESLLWQTPLVVIVLGFTGDRPRLEGFVRQFMLSTIACVVIFALWPAEGPFAAYGYAPNAAQARYLEHLHALRDGSRTLMTWRGAEGLITFPSFHTCWAVLLAWAFSGRRSLRLPAVLLNTAVVLSTMTTGWHYFTDVLGGLATAGMAIAVSTAWARQRTKERAATPKPMPAGGLALHPGSSAG